MRIPVIRIPILWNRFRAPEDVSEERRRKRSEARKGKHHSPETRGKISDALMGRRHPGLKGKKNPFWGRHHSEETKRKISETQKGKPQPWNAGENNSSWQGGISSLPYCSKFNREFKERVRVFFGYRCVICGKTQEKNGRRLCVHHVNYKKEACCDEEIPKLFTTLCVSCHTRTGCDRDYWQKVLSRKIKKKFNGRCYLHRGEIGVSRARVK